MVQNVSDARSNANDQLAHAADTIGRSEIRRAVFDAICRGKKPTKSVSDLMEATGLARKQVLTAGKHLADHHLVEQNKVSGEVAYTKDSFLSANRRVIYRLIDKPKARDEFPTKTSPRTRVQASTVVTVQLPRGFVDVKAITVDEIDSFRLAWEVPKAQSPTKMSESDFKEGLKQVLQVEDDFKDWGGEPNDLFTDRLVIKGERSRAAFALKGPGQRAKRLVPKMMGKNGDQIQRLFKAEADLYVVQYWNQVDQAIHDLMYGLAVAKSATSGGARVRYAVIDGSDSTRLIKAYPKEFGTAH